MDNDKLVSKQECCGCGACYSICPKNAISMKYDEEGFEYPVIDDKICVNCNSCSKVCPVQNHVCESEFKVQAFAAYNLKEEQRLQSSSGGIFPLIAEYFLQNGGVVYGAAFTDNFEVEHIGITRMSELKRLQGSKYVQSRLGRIFLDVKDALLDNKIVLFSGTPCQVEGLKSFLIKDYNNLYTIDLVCHGVPSPIIWQKYLNEEYGIDSITYINFRDKKNGWANFDLQVSANTESSHEPNPIAIYKEDYLRGFLKELYLRPSCHNCSFKRIKHVSDVTLGDLWGNKTICPDFADDNKGISAVFVQSKKGELLLEQIESMVKIQSINIKDVIRNNMAMVESAKPHTKRRNFFEEIKKNDAPVIKLIHKYIGPSLRKRISVYLKNKFKKQV